MGEFTLQDQLPVIVLLLTVPRPLKTAASPNESASANKRSIELLLDAGLIAAPSKTP